MKNLVIDRKKWGTGREGGSLLNTNNEKLCCLGFFCLAAGASRAQIRDTPMPVDYYSPFPVCQTESFLKEIAPLVKKRSKTEYQNNRICGLLSVVNDSESKRYKNPAKREARIKELFAKVGTKVKFIN